MSLTTIADLKQSQDVSLCMKEAESISGRFHNWILNGGDQDPHSRAPGIHASEISSCQRRLFYSMKGTPRGTHPDASQTFKIRLQKIFLLGHVVHDMLQKQFGKFASSTQGDITFTKEVPIDPYSNPVGRLWKIYSSCDGIFTFWRTVDGRREAWLRVGLEIKSTNPDDFDKIKRPLKEHVEQGHVYQACHDLPLMWFLYYNKSNVNMTTSGGEFLVPFNEAIWENLQKRFEAAHDAVDRDEIPAREESFECELCSYSWKCDPEKLKKTFKRGLAAHLPRK